MTARHTIHFQTRTHDEVSTLWWYWRRTVPAADGRNDDCRLGFACLVLGKSSKNISGLIGLKVIYHGTKQQVTLIKSKQMDFVYSWVLFSTKRPKNARGEGTLRTICDKKTLDGNHQHHHHRRRRHYHYYHHHCHYHYYHHHHHRHPKVEGRNFGMDSSFRTFSPKKWWLIKGLSTTVALS